MACGGGSATASRPSARLLTTPLFVRGRSFCCSCAPRSSLWVFTISARFLQAAQLREGLSGLREVIGAFFTKRHIWYYIAFIILYRLGEGFVMKIVPLFLKADTASGGLGLTNQQIGLYYGTFGAGAFLLGSLLAGYLHRPTWSAADSFHAVLVSSTCRSGSTPCLHGSSLRACGSWAVASSWSTSATDSDSWASRCL